MESDADYVIGADGRITFTPEGRAFYTAYFGYAGIDIRNTATAEDFMRAGRQAFPFRVAFMAQRLRNQQQTLERRALRAIVEDDWAGLERIDRQLATRAQLRVIPGSRGGHQAPR
jgi:hypothetical protein